MATVPFPAFADRLPAKLPTLRDLWLAAADAEDALRRSPVVTTQLEDAASDAADALRDHLLFEHGLTAADLKRSVF